MSANTRDLFVHFITLTSGKRRKVGTRSFSNISLLWFPLTIRNNRTADLRSITSAVFPQCAASLPLHTPRDPNKRTIGRVQHVLMCRFTRAITAHPSPSDLDYTFASDLITKSISHDASFLCTETWNLKRFVRYFRKNVKPKLKNTTFSSLLTFSLFLILGYFKTSLNLKNVLLNSCPSGQLI